MSSTRSKQRSESLDGDLTPTIAASSLKFSDQFEPIQTKWYERLIELQKKVAKLEDAQGKASTPAKDALYSESELLRMDYLEEPDVATYYHAREKAPDTVARTSFTELPQGKLIEKWLAEHDEIRNRFKLPVIKNNGPEVILRMILAILYTLALFPIFFLMLPLRLLHPLLRACGLQNNHLPIDMVQKWFSRSFLAVSGVTCTWEGLDNLDRATGTIGMFTHASNLDPFIIASGPLAFKWIGKKQIFQTPFVGWLLAGWGHIAIDRSNRAAAIASLDAAVQKIHTWGRNIAISPEGTRSTTGRLLDFKKGPFHIATQVGNPITPMLVFNAYELWSPHQIFVKPGHVTVRFLPQIPVSKADTPHTLQVKVRRAMLQNLAIPSDQLKPSPQYTNPQYDILFLPIAYFVTWIIYKYIKYSYF